MATLTQRDVVTGNLQAREDFPSAGAETLFATGTRADGNRQMGILQIDLSNTKAEIVSASLSLNASAISATRGQMNIKKILQPAVWLQIDYSEYSNGNAWDTIPGTAATDRDDTIVASFNTSLLSADVPFTVTDSNLALMLQKAKTLGETTVYLQLMSDIDDAATTDWITFDVLTAQIYTQRPTLTLVSKDQEVVTIGEAVAPIDRISPVPIAAQWDQTNTILIVWFDSGLETGTPTPPDIEWADNCFLASQARESINITGVATVNGSENSIEVGTQDLGGFGDACTGVDRVTFTNASGLIKDVDGHPIAAFTDLAMSDPTTPVMTNASLSFGSLTITFDQNIKAGSYDKTKWQCCDGTKQLTLPNNGSLNTTDSNKIKFTGVTTGGASTCTGTDDMIEYLGGDTALVGVDEIRVLPHSEVLSGF